MFARYEYDALGQRIRIMEFGTYENKTFTFDALLHFRKVRPRRSKESTHISVLERLICLIIYCLSHS